MSDVTYENVPVEIKDQVACNIAIAAEEATFGLSEVNINVPWY